MVINFLFEIAFRNNIRKDGQAINPERLRAVGAACIVNFTLDEFNHECKEFQVNEEIREKICAYFIAALTLYFFSGMKRERTSFKK
ncbi:MAG: hypothetical protein KKC76_04740 [Proteobacteria bacterium]|nr:hypothetical protein [Pseudomonadota bacterium]MBU4294305.1 hypothetical protein [Pseudomonadota bacterium]MCG2746118.1 hypothetical protein [Desulfobulbaceae bacterium]